MLPDPRESGALGKGYYSVLVCRIHQTLAWQSKNYLQGVGHMHHRMRGSGRSRFYVRQEIFRVAVVAQV